MITVRPLLIVALCAAACQPWYRDHERRAQRAHDDARTEREVSAAIAARAAGQPARAADLLREVVERNPEAEVSIWLLLGQAEADAGHAVLGRAYVRWRLGKVGVGGDAAGLRGFLVASFVAEGRVAAALDVVEPQTLEAALAFAPLAGPLRELQRATEVAATDPDQALVRLRAWLDGYGVPDHPILVGAREAIAEVLWRAAAVAPDPSPLARLRRLGADARDELARGQAATALALYAEAVRLWPAAQLEGDRVAMARAAATAAPSALDPVADTLARDGDALVARGQLGAAIARYRRAVASAPWWPAVRTNLDALLAVDRPVVDR